MMEPHMIENYVHYVLAFGINHVGFMVLNLSLKNRDLIFI